MDDIHIADRRHAGHIFNSADEVVHTVHGSWDKGLVLSKGKLVRSELPKVEDAFANPNNIVLWKANPTAEWSAGMFGLPVFSMWLNQEQVWMCCDTLITTLNILY